MSRWSVAALVFDLDDTLYPERAYAESALREVAERFSDVLGAPEPAYARMCALLDGPSRERIFDTMLAERGTEDAAALVPRMIATYRTHQPVLETYLDAEAALDRWLGRVPLGLVTDGPVDIQQGKIDALGIGDRFAATVITGQWGQGYYKPHRRAFDEIERRLGVHGPRCAYVADNLTKDFVAPRALGWRTLHIQRPEGLYVGLPAAEGGEPEMQIESLDELDACLAS